MSYKFNPFTGSFDDAGPVPVTIAAMAPSNPKDNDLWWDSTNGLLFVYYNDGSSSQWVTVDQGSVGFLPAGSNKQIQFNDNGVLAGDGGLTYDKATGTLTVTAMPRSTGWMDITPFESGDDGTNGAVNVAIPTLTRVYGREFPGNASTTRNRTYRFHIPHDIALNPTQAFFHLHWCHVIGAPTGTALFQIYINACQRDGTPIAEQSTTLTLTPTAGNAGRINMVNEVDISGLTGILTSLKVDAFFGFYVERNAANDDFNNSIYIRGADMHVQSDGKNTTSKDEGAGWAKVGV